jgi:hypothetical protein
VRLQCGRRGGHPSPHKVGGLRKRRRHDWERWADDAEVIPPPLKCRPPPAETPRFGTMMGGRHGGRPSPIKVQASASGDATVGDGDVRTTRRSSLPIKVQASASGDTTIRGRWADDAEVIPPPLKWEASAISRMTSSWHKHWGHSQCLPCQPDLCCRLENNMA